MNTPTPPPATLPEQNKGSLLIGFLIGWGLMIGISVLSGGLMAVLAQVIHDSTGLQAMFSILGLLPLLSMIVAIVWSASQGRTRMALGIALSFASMIALCLLLVAACFGLFAMSGSGWH